MQPCYLHPRPEQRRAVAVISFDQDSPWLADPGGRDWLQLRLTEWHRADTGAMV